MEAIIVCLIMGWWEILQAHVKTAAHVWLP